MPGFSVGFRGDPYCGGPSARCGRDGPEQEPWPDDFCGNRIDPTGVRALGGRL